VSSKGPSCTAKAKFAGRVWHDPGTVERLASDLGSGLRDVRRIPGVGLSRLNVQKQDGALATRSTGSDCADQWVRSSFQNLSS
jgi:hypothetical protein